MSLHNTEGAECHTGQGFYVIYLSKQKVFGNWQIYVAFSKSRKLSDLYKSKEIEKSAIKADQGFLYEYERLGKKDIFFNLAKFARRFQMH